VLIGDPERGVWHAPRADPAIFAQTTFQGATMAKAQQGDTVRVHYTGTLNNGEQFDSSRGMDPLTFTLGEGSVIQGFDDAVDGMAVGESKRVTIPAAEAYGVRRDELTLRIPRAELPTDLELEVGSQLRMEQGAESVVVTVRDLDDDSVMLDANHPLAGEPLTFDLELVEIV
jgi:peptidylprolyl isomerase